MSTVDEYFLSDDHPSEYFLGIFPFHSDPKSERSLPDLSLIYEVWGTFWEELKLKYAMFVHQLDKVKEDDILTFSFLGFKFFGKFKIRSA